MKARVIAFYLPQFHPIPENDEWWGKGFTEWTNVAQAKPQYKGHIQPNVPADLGFYDLRLPIIREQQAELASKAGIEGFCYWHYWFGDGKTLLNMPINEVVRTGKPDFPFCIAWANHSWGTSTWTAKNQKKGKTMLMEQRYLGEEDYTKFFYSVLPCFQDRRYITVDGKPLFYIFDPLGFPDQQLDIFIKTWRKLAELNGLKGVFFVGRAINMAMRRGEIESKGKESIERISALGFDGVNTYWMRKAEKCSKSKIVLFKDILFRKLGMHSDIYEYKDIIKYAFDKNDMLYNVYPTIVPRWDKTPRMGKKATIYKGSTAMLFGEHIDAALKCVSERGDQEHRIVFLQAWNEWGEGNYMEPDIVSGMQYIETLGGKLIL